MSWKEETYSAINTNSIRVGMIAYYNIGLAKVNGKNHPELVADLGSTYFDYSKNMAYGSLLSARSTAMYNYLFKGWGDESGKALSCFCLLDGKLQENVPGIIKTDK